jgi:hypothetical protein
VTFAACNDTVLSHVFPGRSFEPDRDCLEPGSAVDVVDGPDPGAACTPACYAAAPDEAGTIEVFVSSECAPVPKGLALASDAGDCPRALAALTRGDDCLDEGGSTHPLEAGDDASAE